MALKNHYDALLPAVRCTEETRLRVVKIASAAGCDMADVIRDAVATALVHLELQLGLKSFDDFDEEELVDAGLGRALEEHRTAEALKVVAPQYEDRTRGAAWGAPPLPAAE